LLLLEFYQGQVPEGYQDIDSDKSAPKWKEGRKTKLTLGMLNKMRRMKDVQTFERANDLKKIRQQYKPPEQAPGL
jgi:hypothetical protein